MGNSYCAAQAVVTLKHWDAYSLEVITIILPLALILALAQVLAVALALALALTLTSCVCPWIRLH